MKSTEELSNGLHNIIERMENHNNTSMGIWISYWEARCVLRKLALRHYDKVCKNYEIDDLSFPSEGFKDISNDTNRKVDDMEEVLGI